MKTLFLLITLTISASCFASVYKVGSTRNYKTPNELYLVNVLQAGDTIEIDGEEFWGTATLAVWTSDSLLIRGVNGRPHLMADGQYIHQKGIWVIKGNNCIVENIEFSGAKVPDKNGAGIRLDGTGITIRHCYFHDCEDGILTSNPEAGDILIEYTEFAHNGYGNGYSHNLYVGHVNSLTFRFNYSHHCNVGHCLKSRAQNNFIINNFIADEADGFSSRLIDLPNGGFTIVMGNILMQGAEAINGNAFGFGLEGLANEAPHELYVVNNTFVNKRNNARFISVKEGTSAVHISNNIFAGSGTVLEGTATTLSNNLVETDIPAIGFIDEGGMDYHLASGSPAVEYGTLQNAVNSHSLTPGFEYLHPLQSAERTIVGKIDAGAYEFRATTSTNFKTDPEIRIYPNPVSQTLFITGLTENPTVEIYNIAGKRLLQHHGRNSTIEIRVDHLQKGIYFARIIGSQTKSIRFIKD